MARCMCCELDTVWTTLTKNQANVMLSYPIDEAEELLTGKLAGAKQNLANCEEDQEFLREQITTMEVATARVYNWDVTMKRKEKNEQETIEDGEKGTPNG